MQQVRYVILMVVLILPILGFSQEQQKPFGLQYSVGDHFYEKSAPMRYFLKDTTKKKEGIFSDLKLLFTFDSRNSFLLNQQAKMVGFRFGLEMFDRYRVGLGWYGLRGHIDLPKEIRPHDELLQSLRFTYSTLFFEYVIYEDFKWEAVASLPFGRGTGTIDTLSSLSRVPGERRAGDVNVLAPSIGGHYKLFYWLGIGSGMGYRFVIAPHKNVRQSLSAPFYVIKVKLFLGGIYKSIFKHEEVEAERAAWRNEKRERKERREERRQNKNQE